MIKRLLATGALCATTLVLAQSGLIVEGSVRQQGLGTPLVGDVTVIQGDLQRRMTTVETDASGHFRAAVPGTGPFLVIARVDKYTSAQLSLSAGTYAGVELLLKPAIRLTGEVVDEAGRPVAKARVAIVYPDGPSRFRFQYEVGGIETDDLGRFVLASVSAGSRFALEVDGAGYQLAYTDIRTAESRDMTAPPVVVKRGAALSGIVRDRAANPVRNASVMVVAQTWQAPPALRHVALAHLKPMRRNFVSDVDGRFRLEGLASGEVVVVCRADGYKPLKVRTTIGPATTESALEIELEPASTVP